MKFEFQKSIPITKIDEDERMVYGWASTEDIDSDGEIIKASALEKALPDYLKFPTLREMHQPIAVGKTKNAAIKKEGSTKGLYIGAKVVAQEAWEKVKEGVYPAFSIGGNIVKKVGKVIEELELVEISLVDVPANKAAVVELWKRDKITKDAETVYTLSNLMITIKDTIYYYDYLGKDTKKLKKALELIKQMIAVEAAEPEADSNEKGVKGNGIFTGSSQEEIEDKINILKAMDLSNNPIAQIIREGVISKMSKELKKSDNPKEEEKVETPVASEETQEDQAEETPEGEEPAGEEEKETGDIAVAMEKIAEVEKSLQKMQPSEKDKAQITDISKAINSMAGTLTKFADALSALDGRIAKLESTPAAPKSKSTVVLKGQDPEEDKEPEKEKGLLAKKKARLAELNDLYEKMTPHEFAKAGHSREAAGLKNDIEQLERVQA